MSRLILGGVFVVLLCGLALAIVVAILEFCWNSKKNAQTDRQSLCSEMAEELRFAIRCHGSRHRPALQRSCTKCSPATTYVPAALDLPHLNGVSYPIILYHPTVDSINLLAILPGISVDIDALDFKYNSNYYTL